MYELLYVYFICLNFLPPYCFTFKAVTGPDLSTIQAQATVTGHNYAVHLRELSSLQMDLLHV